MRYVESFKKTSPTWADFKRGNFMTEDMSTIGNAEHMLESITRITKIVDEEVEKLGDSRKCFISGFSQGAFVASAVWNDYTKPLGGLISYAGFGKKINPVVEQEDSPVLWSHGIEETFAAYECGVYRFSPLENGKRRVVHIAGEGLGHGVDKRVAMETRRFMETAVVRPKL